MGIRWWKLVIGRGNRSRPNSIRSDAGNRANFSFQSSRHRATYFIKKTQPCIPASFGAWLCRFVGWRTAAGAVRGRHRVQSWQTRSWVSFFLLFLSTVANDLLNGWPVVLVPTFYIYSQCIFHALHTFDDLDSSHRVWKMTSSPRSQ
jgi:hypothetical protein